MYCQNCGNELNPGAKFCPVCGLQAKALSEAPVPDVDPKLSGKILVFGILSVAFGCSPFLISIVGIVMAIIGRCKIKAYRKAGVLPDGKAKAGNVLTFIGLWLSIGMTFVYGLMLIPSLAALQDGIVGVRDMVSQLL